MIGNLKKYSYILFVYFIIGFSAKALTQDLFGDSFLGSDTPVVPSENKDNLQAPPPLLSPDKDKKETETLQVPPITSSDKDKKETQLSLPELSPQISNNKTGDSEKDLGTDLFVPPPPVLPETTEIKDEPLFTPPVQQNNPTNNQPPPQDKKDLFPIFNSNETGRPSQQLLGTTSPELFREMAEVERQNALLTLQLQREKIRSDIEKLHSERRKALQDELNQKEDARRKQVEWEEERAQKLKEQKEIEEKEEKENEVNQKILELEKTIEQQKQDFLARINFLERDREKLIREKEKIMADAERTIKAIAEVAERSRRRENSLSAIIAKNQQQIAQLKQQQEEVKAAARAAAVKEMEKLEEKIAEAEAKVKASEAKAESNIKEQNNPEQKTDNNQSNTPSSTTQTQNQTENGPVQQQPIPDEYSGLRAAEIYAIAEIRGTGNNLIVRLITSDGLSFYAKKGTILASGHTVTDIQKTHIMVTKNKQTDLIAFPPGGVMDAEPMLPSKDGPPPANNAPAAPTTIEEVSKNPNMPGLQPMNRQ